MWTIHLPLKIACDDRSKPVKHRPGWEQPYFALNLNQYRNAHPMVLNNAKVNFEITARKLIRAAAIPKLDRCTLEYVLYTGTRQLCDTNNICSIADKFFSDSLVSAGVLTDDNYNFIIDSRFRFGAIDRENPRVDVIIRNADHLPEVPFTEKQPMKIVTQATHIINLTQEDIVAALREYLQNEGGLTIASDANLSQLAELSDGSYELRISQGGPVEEAGTTTRRGRRKRLEPKEAMQALHHSAESSEDAGEPAPQQLSAAALSAKEQAAREAEELEQAEQKTAAQQQSSTSEPIVEVLAAAAVEETQTELFDDSTLKGQLLHAIAKASDKETIEAISHKMVAAKTELGKEYDEVTTAYKAAKERITGKKVGLFGNLPRPSNP